MHNYLVTAVSCLANSAAAASQNIHMVFDGQAVRYVENFRRMAGVEMDSLPDCNGNKPALGAAGNKDDGTLVNTSFAQYNL